MFTISVTADTKVLQQLPQQLRAETRFLLEAVKKQVEAEYQRATAFSKNIQNDFGAEINQSSVIAFFRERPAVGATTGIAHSPKGRTKAVPLRGQKATNVTQIVDEGRGGIRPQQAQILLIDTKGKIPVGQMYVIARGKVYVYAQAAGSAKGRHFSEQANQRIDAGLQVTIDAAWSQL